MQCAHFDHWDYKNICSNLTVCITVYQGHDIFYAVQVVLHRDTSTQQDTDPDMVVTAEVHRINVAFVYRFISEIQVHLPPDCHYDSAWGLFLIYSNLWTSYKSAIRLLNKLKTLPKKQPPPL